MAVAMADPGANVATSSDVDEAGGSDGRFFTDLNYVVNRPCSTLEALDSALRMWLYQAVILRDQPPLDPDPDPDFTDSDTDTVFRNGDADRDARVASCARCLLASTVFGDNRDYVRKQIVYSLLQEDEAAAAHVIATFLLLDGRGDEDAFRRMMAEGCFARLLELIRSFGPSHQSLEFAKNPGPSHQSPEVAKQPDPSLHRAALDLIYEMSRIERVPPNELVLVDDSFITHLFGAVEAPSDDSADPYHYSIIRVLLVLNEQYMIASTAAPAADGGSGGGSASDGGSAWLGPPLTNRVVKVLSTHGPAFRSFGENIILLLNRETETSLQLLILKLLYLLFTTKATYEYFYTNDLRVLVDVILRNLLDLPNSAVRLRHTYLRVLHPLLGHTQLNQSPYYKRDEILKVLRLLSGGCSPHFEPADETTLRLVKRVCMVGWLEDEDDEEQQQQEQQQLQKCGHGQAEVAQRLLGMSLSESQSGSASSFVDVTAVFEKPGVKTPSRKNNNSISTNITINTSSNSSNSSNSNTNVVTILVTDTHMVADDASEEAESPTDATLSAFTSIRSGAGGGSSSSTGGARPRKALPEIPRRRQGPGTPTTPERRVQQPLTTGGVHLNGNGQGVPGQQKQKQQQQQQQRGKEEEEGQPQQQQQLRRQHLQLQKKRAPPKVPPPRRTAKVSAVSPIAGGDE